MKQRRTGLSLAALAAVAAIYSLALIASPTPAAAEPIEHVFNAKRSLRGDCSVSTKDPVADPTCPGGNHPPRPFRNPCGTVTDSYGNIYVASSAVGVPGTEGRIDVFNPKGEFLTEIEEKFQPCDLAVDSEGNLYVLDHSPHELEPNQTSERVYLFSPPTYPPQLGAVYPTEEEAVIVYQNSHHRPLAIAVDPANDHLYIRHETGGIAEYGSAADNLPGGEWTPLREGVDLGIDGVLLAGGFDVYGKNHYIYSPGTDPAEPDVQRVFIIDPTTGEKVCDSDGSETPAGSFSYVFANAAIAVDQSSGNFYLDDTKIHKVIDRFGPDCKYIDRLPQPPELQTPDFRAGLAADSPCIGVGELSCDLGGYHSPNQGNVYVGSGINQSNSNLFAFTPKVGGPPELESQLARDITATEARLRAKVNPADLETQYHFEYIGAADYKAAGDQFGLGASSVPVPDSTLEAGNSFVEVSASVFGLLPESAYRFRLVATNQEGTTRGVGSPGGNGEDASFTTYAADSGGLPDGRGYELVTPPNTGGYVPTMNELGFTPFAAVATFPTDPAGPGGEGLLFGVEGGSLPGLPGGGFHDTYEAHRESIGAYGRWQSEFNGITGAQAREPVPDGFSSDHETAFWAVIDPALGPEGNYLRRAEGVVDPTCSPEPAGHLELIGCGSLGTDDRVVGGWISANAAHIIFATLSETGHIAQRLEPQAPPTGTGAVYDRTADGITHVVSLKPGEIPFAAGENAIYQGASDDGTAVAFRAGGTLYARVDNQRTSIVAEGQARFGGLSRDGSRLIYLRPNASDPTLPGTQIPRGEIFACPVRSGSCDGPGGQAPIQIGSGEESVLVNVSADGSHVYFASPKALDSAGQGVAGEENLYLWDGAAIHFVAGLDPADVIGRPAIVSGQRIGGLGLWATNAVAPLVGPSVGPGGDPSRTTADGGVLLFESRADLTGYDANGHSQVYRYDSGAAAGERLACLSCNPTGTAASSDAQLQSDPPPQFITLPPVNQAASLANLTANGRRAFFQSAERLVLGDADGKLDVYQWEANGEGDCAKQAGCVRLISSPQSAADEYLYAIGPAGRDVFFESGDLLVPRDSEAAPSIYDARIGGGEAPESTHPPPCQGDACQALSPAPPALIPASSTFEGVGSRTRNPPCPKGKRRVRRAGKRRCATRHPHHRGDRKGAARSRARSSR